MGMTHELLIRLFSYYWEAEWRGAKLLMTLFDRAREEVRVKLTQHFAEEAYHASLWARRISALGGAPVIVDDGYQKRIGKELGVVPKTVTDLLALTQVIEERSQSRYLDHASWPDVDPDTRIVLERILEDEKWHLAWVKKELEYLVPDEDRLASLLEQYREAERRAFEGLVAKEHEAFGFSLSKPGG